MKRLRLLFIGNSHTYFNDMPIMVKARAEELGYQCEVTMIAHSGWFLAQHVNEPDARFNILFGNYDYVILQEHAHPFGPVDKFLEAAKTLASWAKDVGSVPILYETWSMKTEPEKQQEMNDAYRFVADETNALVAPVGETWWACKRSWLDLELYYEDGQHASKAGSDFAAKYIWDTIFEDLSKKK